MSEAKKGKNNPMFGKTYIFSEQQRDKMSQAKKRYWEKKRSR